MSLLIETICLQDGEFKNLDYHEQRAQHALTSLFGSTTKPGLEAYLKNVEFPQQGLYKCRITYNDQFKKVEFIPYERRDVDSLKIIIDDGISYAHKFEDRHELNALFSKRGMCNDIIIVKQGSITDTSFANIVFKENDRWVTPNTYLLAGTMRQNLIDKGIIIEREIRIIDLHRFTKFKLVNAMVGFEGPEIDVSHIVE